MCKQKLSGLGCRMGNSYVGALLYADDITLLCPIQWCSGKFALVGTLAWSNNHIPYGYRWGGGGS